MIVVVVVIVGTNAGIAIAAYYLKNKEWIQSRQKRWREQRRKLMTKTLKSLAVIDKKNKLKKKTIKSKR
jgi:hypothetical protein